MGFFHEIETTYGRAAASKLKLYSRTLSKLAQARNRKIFLLRCRGQSITPRHVSDRTRHLGQSFEFHDPRTGQQAQHFYNRLDNRVLNFEITLAIKNLHHLEQRHNSLSIEIAQLFPYDIDSEFKRRSHIKYEKEFTRARQALQIKFSRLHEEQVEKIKVKPSWFKNLSDTVFPPDVLEFLSLGPKFSLPPSKKEVSIPNILAEIESINFGDLEQLKLLTVTKVTNILTNFVQSADSKHSLHTNIYNKTQKFLKEHQEIAICQADKGNVTVCLKKEDYVNLSQDILSDHTCYKQIGRDPTSTIQQKANKLVMSLKNDSLIDLTTARRLTIYNSRPARFYGLPKIHKPQLTLRPIISSISCPNSGIAQHVTDVLTAAYNRDNRYFTGDSFTFASFINNFSVPEGFVIVSFDVTSLFTNIPLELVIDSIQRHWNSISQHTDITLQRFLELIAFVFDTTFFTFQDRYYKQIFGTPMGSVISPIVAQYVMDDVLDTVVSKLPFQVPFLKKYVDDIITAVPSDSIEETLIIFNSIHSKIQFTTETESDCSVPFLDMLVIRDGTSIMTDWYIKPTASGRYINFYSFHSMKMKINVIMNMKKRVIRLSHPIYHLNNFKKLVNIMIDNSFPLPLLNKLIYSTRTEEPTDADQQQLDGNPGPNQTVEEPTTGPTFYKTIPHVEGLSNRLTSALSRIPGVRVAMQNKKTIRNLYTHLKDKTPILQQSNVVYSIPCSDCDMVYIGQTSRTVSARVTSHKSDTRTKKSSCQLAIHSNQLRHTMNYEDMKILDTQINTKKRTFLEMVRIAQTDNTMNSRKDIEGLSGIYTYLIHLDKLLKNPHTMEGGGSLEVSMV